jgi:hypothetical protein
LNLERNNKKKKKRNQPPGREPGMQMNLRTMRVRARRGRAIDKPTHRKEAKEHFSSIRQLLSSSHWATQRV